MGNDCVRHPGRPGLACQLGPRGAGAGHEKVRTVVLCATCIREARQQGYYLCQIEVRPPTSDPKPRRPRNAYQQADAIAAGYLDMDKTMRAHSDAFLRIRSAVRAFMGPDNDLHVTDAEMMRFALADAADAGFGVTDSTLRVGLNKFKRANRAAARPADRQGDDWSENAEVIM